MTKDRAVILLYVAAVVLVTTVHDIRFLIAGMLIILFLSGGDFWRIAKRAALAIALFNSIVTISYCILSVIQGSFTVYYVTLINVRVFLLTSMTFLVRERINPFRALGFSKSVLYLLTLAYSQVLTVSRLFDEFRLALRSRSLNRPTLRNIYRHGASTGVFFLSKSLNDTREITQAMRSRGFFDD
jgi:cobalt/nickel transport system permease protein